MKKAVEMTMNVIIVAAILLIVLIVLLVIFSQKMSDNTRQYDNIKDGYDCPQGCYQKSVCSDTENQVLGNFRAYRENQMCCCPK